MLNTRLLHIVWKLRTWTLEANRHQSPRLVSSASAIKHFKRKPGFFIPDEKQTWIVCIVGPKPRSLWPGDAQIQRSQLCQNLMAVTWPQGTDPNVTSYWCQSSWDLTLQTKRPCSWEKISMAQIPQTNSSHPGWFSVCNCQILSKGDHTIPTIPLDSSKFGSLFTVPLLLEGLGAGTQKHFLFSGTNPQPGCPLYLHINLPFSLCYKYPHQHPPHPWPTARSLQDAEKHRDLRVTRPFGIQASPPQAFLPGLGMTSESGCCPFPKIIPGGREEDFWVLHFDTICLWLLLLSSFKGIFRVKSFPPTSPRQRQWCGQGVHLHGIWYTGTHHRGFLTDWSRKGCDPQNCYLNRDHRRSYGTLQDLRARGSLPSVKAWKQSPKPSFTQHPGTARLPWCRPSEPKRRTQPGLAWPGQPTPRRARYWTNCFLPKRAKDSAKSAISIWEVRFSQNTTPLPLLLYSFQYLKGRGRQKTCSTRPLNRIKGFLYAVVPPSWP